MNNNTTNTQQVNQSETQANQGPKPTQRRKVENIEEVKDTEKTNLHRAYTIWAHMKQPKFIQNTYDQVLKPAASFSTVEDFWAVYSHFKRPSLMSFGTTLYLFGEGIKPMWEDEQCKNGGRWMLKLPKSHTNKYWEDLTLAMIGEQYTNENEILGMQLALKPNQDVLSIWIRNGKDAAKVEQIKQDIVTRFIMFDENSMRLDFEDFHEVVKRPQHEKKETPFNRNMGIQPNTGDNEKREDHPQPNQQDDTGFERNQISRGGGFTKGRGRGRGGQRGGME